MLIHYNKILSAKAAVDCSIPKSMIKSIKYSDQQRRESMKKEVARLERTSSHSAASSRRRSRDSSDSVIHWKDTYDPHAYLLRHSPYSDPGPVYSPSSFISFPRHLRSPDHAGKLPGRHTEFSRMHCSHSTAAWVSPCKFQDNQIKTYNGDVLEKYSHHFTNKERPFTPRILKTQAKSALAQSRYYTQPRRRRKGTATEAETQTDLSSFRHTEEMESQPIRNQEQQLSDEEEEEPVEQQLSFSRFSSSDFKSPSPTLQKIHSEGEELAYLSFVADVTNEILTLGLFSDRVLERVFQQHLEKNRHRLDEGKMCHLLDILRADLQCKEESDLKSVVNNQVDANSPWDVVRNGNFQEEASLYPNGLFTSQHLHMDSLPCTDKEVKHQHPDDALIVSDTRDTELEDYVPRGADVEDGDHHQEGNAQTDQGNRSDCTLHPSHDYILTTLDDGGSPAHENVDHQVIEASEDNLLNVSGKDHTLDEQWGNLPISRQVSEETEDLETLEDLQQSFSDVIQVSRGDDVSEPGERSAAETNSQSD
ncbi:hypothetical protein GDO78_010800 [Eleutherodactylus coqui]|uniref:Spermatogenesis associated 7 n=3 Tax=Eleutherodactylus coqui TaxID=57060 RepID=A0A8J6F643_ELECQ|nr:hypothetical protein GDO78_010800 [Eleutherodactylus coqui]